MFPPSGCLLISIFHCILMLLWESCWLSLAELTLQNTREGFGAGQGYGCSRFAAWCDMPPCWRPLPYAWKSSIAFNSVFLALLTGSTPSSTWGVGSFELPPHLGSRQVALGRAAAVPAGHGVDLKLFLWCCPACFCSPSGFSGAPCSFFSLTVLCRLLAAEATGGRTFPGLFCALWGQTWPWWSARWHWSNRRGFE